jgi:hypothetical protein
MAVSSASVTQSMPQENSAGAVTVLARPVGDSTTAPPRRAPWIAAAAAAFLLPITVAAAFVALSSRSNEPALIGEIYGGIEIASKSVKATVIDLYRHKDLGYDYRILSKKSHTATLGTGMGKTQKFDAATLSETVAAVKEYFEDMTKNQQIPPDRIIVVCGSGVFAEIRGREDLIRTNQSILADAVAKATGQKMDFIEVSQEVKLMFSGLVPQKEVENSCLIDMGGGATRGGYRELDGLFVTFEAPGYKKFLGHVKKQAKAGALADVVAEKADEEIRQPLNAQQDKKPGLVTRDQVYLNGGIVWVLATFQRPQDRKDTVELSAKDIEDFYALVRRHPGDHPPLRWPPSEIDAKVRADAEREVASIKEKFTPQELVVGTEILKALSEEFHFKKKKLIFTRNGGDVGWLLTYIGEKGIAGK